MLGRDLSGPATSLACEHVLEFVLILYHVLKVAELASGDAELGHDLLVIESPSNDGSENPPLLELLLLLLGVFVDEILNKKSE